MTTPLQTNRGRCQPIAMAKTRAESGPSFTIPSPADFFEVAEVVDRRRRVAGVGSVGRREVECVVELQAVREVAVEPVRNDIVILLGLLEECNPDDSNIIS